jgi:hypothetical protein
LTGDRQINGTFRSVICLYFTTKKENMNIKLVSLVLAALFGLLACESQSQNKKSKTAKAYSNQFSSYWFQGKAELNSYELTQARYGELRQGEAVLIFVTEDFSESKQVKLDDPSANAKDAVKVLKLNRTRKFNTGIYPYSMMESVFTPLDRNNYPNSVKVTTSSQEWCGHTFSQFNLDGNKFNFSGKSYFESEGDEETNVKTALLESELMNIIRLDNERIPTGEIEIIPSGFFSRLTHQELKVLKANASMVETEQGTKVLELNYSEVERKVRIEFSSEFPFEILGWEETYKSGFGNKAKLMTTKAVKKKTILFDYWTKNHLKDSTYRNELMLD